MHEAVHRARFRTIVTNILRVVEVAVLRAVFVLGRNESAITARSLTTDFGV